MCSSCPAASGLQPSTVTASRQVSVRAAAHTGAEISGGAQREARRRPRHQRVSTAACHVVLACRAHLAASNLDGGAHRRALDSPGGRVDGSQHQASRSSRAAALPTSPICHGIDACWCGQQAPGSKPALHPDASRLPTTRLPLACSMTHSPAFRRWAISGGLVSAPAVGREPRSPMRTGILLHSSLMRRMQLGQVSRALPAAAKAPLHTHTAIRRIVSTCSSASAPVA